MLREIYIKYIKTEPRSLRAPERRERSVCCPVIGRESSATPWHSWAIYAREEEDSATVAPHSRRGSMSHDALELRELAIVCSHESDVMKIKLRNVNPKPNNITVTHSDDDKLKNHLDNEKKRPIPTKIKDIPNYFTPNLKCKYRD